MYRKECETFAVWSFSIIRMYCVLCVRVCVRALNQKIMIIVTVTISRTWKYGLQHSCNTWLTQNIKEVNQSVNRISYYSIIGWWTWHSCNWVLQEQQRWGLWFGNETDAVTMSSRNEVLDFSAEPIVSFIYSLMPLSTEAGYHLERIKTGDLSKSMLLQ